MLTSSPLMAGRIRPTIPKNNNDHSIQITNPDATHGGSVQVYCQDKQYANPALIYPLTYNPGPAPQLFPISNAGQPLVLGNYFIYCYTNPLNNNGIDIDTAP